ncbi:LysM peptidoglycan-binding domain-containing protein [Bacteroidia bacterium]|nr:LysM peptidoglycan-binding domain-containing protein [Bacteroidia bacterium]MDB9882642.1 LysM peptidoglycan-binding domain-containing protein [Bacteroidia bacterium]
MRASLTVIFFCFQILSYGQQTDEDLASKLVSIESVLPLDYNEEVRQHILEFTGTYNKRFKKILKKYVTYDNYLKDIFISFNVPEELRFAAISLSRCENLVSLSEGREGYFKMRYRTAINHGLSITNYVDERRDVLLSAEAFCKEISLIFSKTNNWQSAFMTYAVGDLEWQKAKVLSRDTIGDFWTINKYLPFEYRSEYPKFIAAVFLANYYTEYDYKSNPLTLMTEQVLVEKYITLYQLSSRLDIDNTLLRELNPTYKKNIIPSVEKEYYLTIPSSKVSTFYDLGDQAYNYTSTPVYTGTEVKFVQAETKNEQTPETEEVVSDNDYNQITYHVRNGDILLKIADLFDCGVVDIKRWNQLTSDFLDINQEIIIKVSPDRKAYYQKIDKMSNEERRAVIKKD